MNALIRILFPRAARIEKALQPAEPAPLHFCRNCRHRRVDRTLPDRTDYDGCHAPQNVTVDLVSGRNVLRWAFCETLRGSNGETYCGRDGRWFVPVETTGTHS